MDRDNKVPIRDNTQDKYRDYLAIYRTVLANERTFLAYTRTILVLAGGAVSLIKLFDHLIIQTLGWVLAFIAVVILIIGVMRYRRMRKLIRSQAINDGFTDVC